MPTKPRLLKFEALRSAHTHNFLGGPQKTKLGNRSALASRTVACESFEYPWKQPAYRIN